MTERCFITIRRGGLYFTSAIYERYFGSLENVVFLRDGGCLLVMPIRHQAAGGYVIKRRNAAGDRTVHAADFFRDNGLEDSVEKTFSATWSEDRAALVVQDAFE